MVVMLDVNIELYGSIIEFTIILIHIYLIYGTTNGTYGIKCMLYGNKYIKYMV